MNLPLKNLQYWNWGVSLADKSPCVARSQTHYINGVVMQACNLSNQMVEAEGSEVQHHP